MGNHFIGSHQDIDEIRRIRREIEDAVRAGDAEALGRHFHDAIAQLPPDQVLHGRDAVMDAAKGAYEAYDMEEHFSIDSIVVVGDLAIEHGTFELTMTPKAGGDTVEVSDQPYAYVYERIEDGWRVLRMSWQLE